MELRASGNLPFDNDYDEIIRAFAPHVSLSEVVNININFVDNGDFWSVKLDTASYFDSRDVIVDKSLEPVKQRAILKRHGKVMLYDYVAKVCGRVLPYGSLTGIRPTKLMREMLNKGLDAERVFVDDLRVQPSVAQYIRQIVSNQNGIYQESEDGIDLFVNIPICVTRCSYCSFISAELGKIKKLVKPYVEQLIREIQSAIKLVKANNYKLRAIYVGGGTPTSLDEEDFSAVMQALKGLDVVEFTVEAGRPDTITKGKLQAMQDASVTRISVNPQTFNDSTLQLIGRSHSAQDILKTYDLARQFTMDINMDLIAMLPSESLQMFQKSVLKTIELAPDNITVHTLSLKRGSNLKQSNYDNSEIALSEQMLNFSKKALTNAGYKPYYMYKQKYMSGSLENTGYAKVGKACVYNIDIMEESYSILACGAGGISKRIFGKQGRLERLANPKGIDVYLEREEIIERDKQIFFNREDI